MESAHALIIGIADYEHVPKLPPTVLDDARDIRDVLVDPQHCGYPPEQVRLLLDGEATREAILGGLAQLSDDSDPESSVLVYVSSHGGRVQSGPDAGEYLIPVDTVPGEGFARTAISGDELTQALRAIPARKVLVVFDCCHSGGIGQPKDATGTAEPVFKAGLSDDYYERLAAGRGRAILSSSRDTEFSYVLPGAQNSLFTQHLLTGLRGGIASEDGLIRVFDLFEYVQPRVTHDRRDQHPIFKADLEENFPVALFGGGTKGLVAKDADGFRFDAYVSYVDREPDSTWVWSTLVPRLEQQGLRVAVSGDSSDPGVPLVVSAERGIAQAKRTLVVLSRAYLEDTVTDFENVVAQFLGITEGSYRLLPVRIEPFDDNALPPRLAMLTALDLTRPERAEREWDRLTKALKGPLPRQ
ncbi:caspase family protein [Intrasporangium sp.]|uniref:caspase family protein n=1 Tax=Intrasporangium sp. TaxID=1925024 RepID=UPI00293A4847|nr:caspase family protein [Intrasporangium sp.]MDV3222450.1 caspase family protein [Intrasporangium sp.]